jgi:hypothetical protein
VQDEPLRTAFTVARSAERCAYWAPRHWPDLAVVLLVARFEDPEIAELAGLPASVTGWDTDPLLSALYERYEVRAPQIEDAVAVLARLMTDDLRARPAAVTAPMIRLVARLAPPDHESDLANACFGCEEYLDCECGRVDPQFESELENLPPLQLPDGLVQVLARPLRATLPLVQPQRSH